MDLRRIRGRAVRAEHGLHLVPHFVGDDCLVHSRVRDSLVADAALVVRVRQHPMHRRLADGSGWSPRRRRSREAARHEFVVELARRPVTGCEHLERPPHQRGSFLVDLDGTYLPPELVAHADVAVADGCLRHGAALRGLLRQTLDDLGREVAGVELGNRRHDAVQQHPRWGLVNVLRGRHQCDPGVLEREVDGHVVG